MSETHTSESRGPAMSQEEMSSALFAQLVMQQANMAMMLLGKVAHPESGQVVKDLEAASLFIDQLEMLEGKTKGNLTKEEAGLLKQSLMSLRLAYVEEADSPQGSKAPEPAEHAGPAPEPASAAPPASAPGEEEEHRKKFSKKY